MIYDKWIGETQFLQNFDKSTTELKTGLNLTAENTPVAVRSLGDFEGIGSAQMRYYFPRF